MLMTPALSKFVVGIDGAACGCCSITLCRIVFWKLPPRQRLVVRRQIQTFPIAPGDKFEPIICSHCKPRNSVTDQPTGESPEYLGPSGRSTAISIQHKGVRDHTTTSRWCCWVLFFLPFSQGDGIGLRQLPETLLSCLSVKKLRVAELEATYLSSSGPPAPKESRSFLLFAHLHRIYCGLPASHLSPPSTQTEQSAPQPEATRSLWHGSSPYL